MIMLTRLMTPIPFLVKMGITEVVPINFLTWLQPWKLRSADEKRELNSLHLLHNMYQLKDYDALVHLQSCMPRWRRKGRLPTEPADARSLWNLHPTLNCIVYKYVRDHSFIVLWKEKWSVLSKGRTFGRGGGTWGPAARGVKALHIFL